MPNDQTSIAVLFSGNGTNMQSVIKHIQQGRIKAQIACAITNRADAGGLERAKQAGIPAYVVEHGLYPSRESFEEELIRILESYGVETIVLAGFMRVFSEVFVKRFAYRILNIHPSLLPKYAGLGTHDRVLAAKDSQHGCSVHFVTTELDEGPLVLQAKVPVFETDDVHSLIRRVLEKEHMVFPLAIRWFCEGKLQCNDGTVYFNNKVLEKPLQLTIAHKTELV